MLEVAGSEVLLEAVFWNSRGRVPKDNEKVDIVFTPEINTYNGRDRLQLILADWRSEDMASFAAKSGAEMHEMQLIDRTPTLSFAQPGINETASSGASQSGKLGTASGVVDFSPPGANVVREAAGNSGAGSSSVGIVLPGGVDGAILAQASGAKSANVASKIIWKDLRGHAQPDEILLRAAQKFGSESCIFGETIKRLAGANFSDRTAVTKVQHLVFAQFPPSQKVFQEVVAKANPSHIYLLGVLDDMDDTAAYLKRLIGLVKFAINQKEGQVEGEKLAALMGSTKMSLALGLTVLRKVHLIDWFAEDGNIFLDWLGDAAGSAEELSEFKQLGTSLHAAREFRAWCQKSGLKDIQLGLMLNEEPGAPQ